MDDGEIVTYALGKLDDRGRMFVKAGDPVYEGMIVGIHSRDTTPALDHRAATSTINATALL